MVTASYKQVLGKKKSDMNSSNPDDVWGTMFPLFQRPFQASAACLAPETRLHPGDVGQARGHGMLCRLGACKGWRVPWHPSDVAFRTALCPVHGFSSHGAWKSCLWVFFVVGLPFWGSPADQLGLTR